jgi:hypothetical protein
VAYEIKDIEFVIDEEHFLQRRPDQILGMDRVLLYVQCRSGDESSASKSLLLKA